MSEGSTSGDTARLSQLRELFLAALELPEAVRERFCDERCAGDREMREQLLKLLAADDARSEVEAEEAVEEAALPDAFGPYEVESIIGSGGMGTVYRGRQSVPIRRDVAIKVVRAEFGGGDMLARFELERRALAAMNHRSIARILDAGATADGAPYFVMELVDGPDLTAFCDLERQSVRQRVELFQQVCLGVQHAHSRGVVHRDLKPSNVLVARENGEPVVKILDFGLAKIVHSEFVDPTAVTRANIIMGTPEYMSPEQAAGTGQLIDSRSDIYSLGVMLYELLTGERPFDGPGEAVRDWLATQRQILETEPARPSTRLGDGAPRGSAERFGTSWTELRRAVRGDLDWITMRAIAKDPDRRYGSAAEFAMDLGRYLAHEPVSAGPPTSGYRLRKFARKYRGRLAVVATVIVALAASSAVAGVSLVRTEQARVEEARQRRRAETEAARAVAVRELITTMLRAPDPYAARSPDYTVRELLDDFVLGLDGQLPGQPAIEAELRLVMSRAYEGLGMYGEAERQAERSLELARGLEDQALVAAAQEALGGVLADLGRTAAAEDLLRASLAGRRAAAPRPLELAASMAALGRLLLWKGEYQRPGDRAEARALLEAALDLERMHRVPGDPEITGTMRALSRLLVLDGERERAIGLAREAELLRRAQRGGDHVSNATNLYNLAIVLRLAGQADAALGHAEAALRIWREQLEAGHPNLASGLLALGRILAARNRRGDREAAVAAVEEALGIWRAIESEQPRVARCLQFLGELAWAAGDPATAAVHFEEERQLRRQSLAEDHRSVLFATQNLAFAWRDAGRLEAAIEEFDGLLQRMVAGGSAPLDRALVRHGFGEALRRAGRLEEAREQLEGALTIREERLESGHWKAAETRLRLGATLLEAGQSEAGVGLLEDAWGQLVAAERAVVATEAAAYLRDHFQALQRPAEAEVWRERAVRPGAGR